jgi:hypothetical protein
LQKRSKDETNRATNNGFLNGSSGGSGPVEDSNVSKIFFINL